MSHGGLKMPGPRQPPSAAAEAGILAQSRAQLDWHRRHQFCSVCGQRTEQGRGGQVRKCMACKADHFPRTDPVAIMVVTDGERCLLGQSRGRLSRTGTYSALAGFMDQGESIEEAVRREVKEEAGIEVGQVRYHSSQPWPFPSSLMIGCHARALTTDIHIDDEEMTDVRWFPRADVLSALRGDHPQLQCASAYCHRTSPDQSLGRRQRPLGVMPLRGIPRANLTHANDQ